MIDLDTVLQGHLEDFYQACTQTAINEAHSVCEDGYYGNKDQFISSFILPVCHLFQTLKKVKQMSLFLKLLTLALLRAHICAHYRVCATMRGAHICAFQ